MQLIVRLARDEAYLPSLGPVTSIALSPIPVPCRALSIALLEDDAELREQILLPGLRHLGFEVTGLARPSCICNCRRRASTFWSSMSACPTRTGLP